LREILLVSDTHGNVPVDLQELNYDTVFHAGDIGSIHTLNEFHIFEHFFAVCGNTDSPVELNLSYEIKAEIEGVKIFMVHNLAAPHRIIRSNWEIITSFNPDVVVYGHCHTPVIEKRDGIVFINPGSLGKAGLSGIISYGELLLENGTIHGASIYDVETEQKVIEWNNLKK